MQFSEIEMKFIPLFSRCRFSAGDLTLICTASCDMFSYILCLQLWSPHSSAGPGVPFCLKEYFSWAGISCSILNLSRLETIVCIFSKRHLHTCPYACSLETIIVINIINGLTKMRLTISLPAIDRERKSDKAGMKQTGVLVFWFCLLQTRPYS